MTLAILLFNTNFFPGDPKVNLLSDSFLAEYVDDLLQKNRQQILRDFVRPYRRVKLTSIAEELNVSTNDVEPILVKCILDGKRLQSIHA